VATSCSSLPLASACLFLSLHDALPILDEVTGYLRPDPALHTYLDEPTGSAWEIERREAYLTLKNELGIEGDLFGVEVTALPEERSEEHTSELQSRFELV